MTEGCFELGLPGGCPDCLAYEKRIDELNAIISDYQADSKNDTDDIVKLSNENKRLRDSLSDCLTLLKECSYDATEVTEKARKLLNQ